MTSNILLPLSSLVPPIFTKHILCLPLPALLALKSLSLACFPLQAETLLSLLFHFYQGDFPLRLLYFIFLIKLVIIRANIY